MILKKLLLSLVTTQFSHGTFMVVFPVNVGDESLSEAPGVRRSGVHLSTTGASPETDPGAKNHMARWCPSSLAFSWCK